MWQRIAVIACVVLGLGLGVARLTAQEKVPLSRQPGDLIADSKWVAVQLVLGRLTITEARLGKDLKAVARCPLDTWQESLSFSASSVSSAAMNYRFLDQRQQLSVEIERGNQLAIDRQPVSGSGVVPVRFVQPSRGPLRLIVEDVNSPREVAAPSFWHLILLEPQLCREHLLPLLEMLHTDWQLDLQAERLEATLLSAARDGLLPDSDRMQKLVEQLDESDFRRRQAADRALRQMGPAAIAFIDRLPDKKLNAEQRYRLRRIRAALAEHTIDSPERVAAWLIDDKLVWFALLQHAVAETRSAAAAQLAILCDQPIEFDPQAESGQRQRQINRLRHELGLSGATQIGAAGTNKPERLR